MGKHQGKILEDIVHDKRLNVSQLIKDLEVSRGTYYNWIKMPKIPKNHISEISEVLGIGVQTFYDEDEFFDKSTVVNEPKSNYGKPESIEEKIELIKQNTTELLKQMAAINTKLGIKPL